MVFSVGVEKLEIGGSFRIVISKDGDHTKLSIANLQMSLGLSDFKVKVHHKSFNILIISLVFFIFYFFKVCNHRFIE